MINVASRHPSAEKATNLSLSGAEAALPNIDFGIDAGETAASHGQFENGARMESKPEVVVHDAETAAVTGVLARVGNFTFRQSSPNEESGPAVDGGTSQEVVFRFGAVGPLSPLMRDELRSAA
jgi:hypothetical protein